MKINKDIFHQIMKLGQGHINSHDLNFIFSQKNCKNCIYFGEENNPLDEDDNKVCLFLNSYVNNNFYCDEFEKKEKYNELS